MDSFTTQQLLLAAGMLALIFLAAGAVEAVVEYLLGLPFDLIQKPGWKAAKPMILAYASALAGVALAFVYRFDFFNILAGLFLMAVPVTAAGMIFTGAIIGRGANFVHQFVSKFFPKPAQGPGA
jgi:hypothetical protein